MLPGKQSHGSLFYTQTQNASKWKHGEGVLLTETLTTKSFCPLTGDREVKQKLQFSTMWWKCKKGNKRCSLTLLLERVQKWFDLSRKRTEQWLLTAGCRRSLMTKVETPASLVETLTRFGLVSLIFLRDRRLFKTQCESHQNPVKKYQCPKKCWLKRNKILNGFAAPTVYFTRPQLFLRRFQAT